MFQAESLAVLPTQYVRNIMKEILSDGKPLEYDDLKDKVFTTILGDTSPTNTDVIIFDNVLSGLVESERVHYLHSHYTINEDFVDNLEEESYILHNDTNSYVNIDGGIVRKFSVGSERYNIWDSFEVGQEVNVVLIPEPTNKFDPNAVAICINNSPVAYLSRSDAKEYFSIVNKLNDMGISLELTGLVSENPMMAGYKYFELAPLPVEEIESLI